MKVWVVKCGAWLYDNIMQCKVDYWYSKMVVPYVKTGLQIYFKMQWCAKVVNSYFAMFIRTSTINRICSSSFPQLPDWKSSILFCSFLRPGKSLKTGHVLERLEFHLWSRWKSLNSGCLEMCYRSTMYTFISLPFITWILVALVQSVNYSFFTDTIRFLFTVFRVSLTTDAI